MRKLLLLTLFISSAYAHADWECTNDNGDRRIYAERYAGGDCKRTNSKPESPLKRAKAKESKPQKQGVSIGMTQQQVLASSWGRPKDINRTTTQYGVREQWVYGGRNYLYFKDGILTSIQN